MQKEIEDLSIFKILLYVVLYLAIIALFIIFYTVPMIKTYKSEHIQYRESLKSYYSILNKHELLKNTLNSDKKTHEKALTAFRTSFNPKDFATFSKKYFKKISIKMNKGKKKKKDFIVSLYKMNYTFHDINSLYKFFDGLKSYPAIIKINFPFILKSSSDNLLQGDWYIKVYESNASI